MWRVLGCKHGRNPALGLLAGERCRWEHCHLARYFQAAAVALLVVGNKAALGQKFRIFNAQPLCFVPVVSSHGAAAQCHIWGSANASLTAPNYRARAVGQGHSGALWFGCLLGYTWDKQLPCCCTQEVGVDRLAIGCYKQTATVHPVQPSALLPPPSPSPSPSPHCHYLYHQLLDHPSYKLLHHLHHRPHQQLYTVPARYPNLFRVLVKTGIRTLTRTRPRTRTHNLISINVGRGGGSGGGSGSISEWWLL